MVVLLLNLAIASAAWIMIIMAVRRGEIRVTSMRGGIVRRTVDPHAFWCVVGIYVLFAIAFTLVLVGEPALEAAKGIGLRY